MSETTTPAFENPTRVVRISPTSAVVRLQGQWVDPVAGRTLAGRTVDLSAAQAPAQDGLRLLQLDGPLDPTTATQLQAAGIAVVGFLPDNTFIIQSGDVPAATARTLARTRWMGTYAPEYRLSERMYKAAQRPARPGFEREFDVRVFMLADMDVAEAQSNLSSVGNAMLVATSLSGPIFEMKILGSQLTLLAAQPGVVSIDYAPKPHVMNNQAADIIQTRPVWNTVGYYGSNEIIAISDSGLDLCSNSTTLIHADFRDGSGNPRVVFLQDYSGDGAHDPISGHGTHVAGSVLGNGALSGATPATHLYPTNCYAGSAPEASLVFQALGRSTNASSIYPPTNLNILFQAAYTNGARIHQNSWGSDSYGSYDTQTREVDEFVFNNPDMLVCYSAGNSGADADADGVVDLGSIGSPGSAKNVLTIGASENYRSNFTSAYGTIWPADFPAAPISTDRTADRTNGMAAFSSRGPCADGRIKPDLVAPGTYIGSIRSHAVPAASNILWGTISGNTNYCWAGGTSMSAPLASGAAALLREYLRRARGLTNPPAALMKALLLNGAQDMSPGQYGTGTTREITNAPNQVEGWGRLALDPILNGAPAYEMRYINGATKPFTNETLISTNVMVRDSNLPLRVHLVWTDYPSSRRTLDTNFSTASGGGLVNDLDLTVTAPGGTIYRPQARDPRISLHYYTNANRLSWFNTSEFLQAELCRAPEVPMTLTHIQQIAYATNTAAGDIATFVWAGTSTGGPPQAVLFAQTNTVPAGGGIWNLDIPLNVVITSRFFFIGSKQITGSAVRQPRDAGGVSKRTAYSSGGAWTWPDNNGDLWIHAFGYAATNDHVNPVEGLIIDQPTTGTWTLTVSAESVPRPPVTYGVAYSGGFKAASNTPPHAPVLHSPTHCPDSLDDHLIANDDFSHYGRTLNTRPALLWFAPLDPDGDDLHFQLYADTADATQLLKDSGLSVTGLAYKAGSGWTAFPAGGLPGNDDSVMIRFQPTNTLIKGTAYFWRVVAYDTSTNSPSSITQRFVIGERLWTHSAITARVTQIRKPQMDELREEANYARACRVLATNSWETITPYVTPIRAVYFTQLYDAIAEITNLTGTTLAPYPTITPKVTPISTNHLQRLRRALEDI